MSFKPNATSEIKLVLKALRSEQFRFIVIQQNHLSWIDEVIHQLKVTYPDRPIRSFGRDDLPAEHLMSQLLELSHEIVLLQDGKALLQDEPFALGFNQRRDRFAKHGVALVLFLPLGADLLQLCARKIPDMWSVRNLVVTLEKEASSDSGGVFMTDRGAAYHRFQSEADIHQEIQHLSPQIEALGDYPSAIKQEITLLIKRAKLYKSLSQYKQAIVDLELAYAKAQKIDFLAQAALALTELGDTLYYIGEYEVALTNLAQALRISREIGNKWIEGTTLNNISQIYDARGDYETALGYLEQSLAIQREIGDKSGEGTTLNNISQIYDVRGDYETALGYLEQSLAIQREIGDKSGEGTTLNNISQIYDARGDYETALVYLEQCLILFREIGARYEEGGTLNNISQIFKARGDYETALVYLEQCLILFREIGARYEEGRTLNNISQIFKARGDYETALGYLEHSLAIQREIGDIDGIAVSQTNIGAIVFEQQQKPEEAFPLFVEAYNIFKQIGSPSEQVPLRYLKAIHKEIGETRFNALLSEIQRS